MRTKALLLTAALGLASVATSMAQVYSVNVVGYVNLDLKTGFNLVASQLNATPDNKIVSVLPSVQNNTQLLKFSNNNYTRDDFSVADGGWLDSETLEPSVRTVSPGEGFFMYSPAPATVTLVGEVRTGNNLTVPLPTGFSLISSIVPQDLALSPAGSAFPVAQNMQFLSWNATAQGYNLRLDFDSGIWINSETLDEVPAPQVTVGQGFFIYSPGPSSWVRSFNPNN